MATTSLGADDYFINDNIQDSIQQLKFYPEESICILGAVGWDTTMRLYQIQYQENISTFGNNNGSCNFNANLYKSFSLQNPVIINLRFCPWSSTCICRRSRWIHISSRF